MASPAIEVRDLGVRFRRNRRGRRSFKDLFADSSRRARPGEFWALRDVSFDVQPGESIGVVGRNGQGKSTLLKLVAGVMLPDEGHVQVNGGVAPLIEITGGFVGDLTVRENVKLTAGLHGMNRAEVDRRFDGMIDFAERDDYIMVAPLGYHPRAWYGSRGAGIPQRLRDAGDTESLPENLGALSEQDVMNVFEIVRGEFNIDEDRMYLWGHSMGGAGTYHLAATHPDLWAALGVAAPAPSACASFTLSV